MVHISNSSIWREACQAVYIRLLSCYYNCIKKHKKHIQQALSCIRFNYLGISFGLVGYFIALTPSLMPRPALFMGVVAGVGFAIGYSIGVFASYIARKWHRIAEPNSATKHRAWVALGVVSIVCIAASSLLARYWQNDQRALLDQPPISNLSALTIVSIALAVFVLLYVIQKSIGWICRRITNWGAKLTFLPPYTGVISVFALAIFVIAGTITGLLERTVIVAIDSSYKSANNYIDPAFPQPNSRLRSGSTGSAANWEGLGREGRRFVSSGPDANAISQFTGKPAKEPIRVYAGLNNADGRHAQVELAMKELERTGAFDRKKLVVATPTGSGWIEAETVAALEYMHDGDTAIVATQYSYLPSGFAFVLDQGDATSMAKELLNAVEDKLHSMPQDTRPKLIAYGLSLGSYGGQSDFAGENDFENRLDAGFFVGTPGFSEPWRTITRDRDAGTPQVEPVYHHAKVIKFVTNSRDVLNDTDPRYKIVYFQYATDPFVWFDARLLYAKPDWMREAPGRGVSSHLYWFPVVTFLQVAIDQIYSLTISGDNGHDYSQDTVAPLAAATKPQNWNADKTRTLQALIAPPTTSED